MSGYGLSTTDRPRDQSSRFIGDVDRDEKEMEEASPNESDTRWHSESNAHLQLNLAWSCVLDLPMDNPLNIVLAFE